MMKGLWDRETTALMLVAAYLPLALFWLWYGGTQALAVLALALLCLIVWNLLFMLARAQPPSFAVMITALAFAMLVPAEMGTFKLLLGLSFGAVMGELVFGGWGRNVVNPATVALSFLGFGFQGYDWPGFDDPVVWAALPAAIIGIATGVMPVAVLLGGLSVGGAALALGAPIETVLPAAGIVLVLLVADPVTSAATTLGQWLNGALYGGLVIMFATGWSGAAPVQIAVAAALLTSLAAPLLDEIALALWISQRRRRHGRT